VLSAEADDRTIEMKPQQEPSTQEVLAGLVERVTFHNDDNGFCVLRIKARGHRELITVVGHAATISAGEWVTASGEWINDHTHGKQFKARFMRTSAPTSIDGIEKYLGSGMIRGIGPVYAKKLVRAFGEKVFDTIEAEPDRLREVTGIGPVRAKRITDAWAEQKIVREIMVFLHSQSGQNRSRPTKLNIFCSRRAAQSKADSKRGGLHADPCAEAVSFAETFGKSTIQKRMVGYITGPFLRRLPVTGSFALPPV